MVTSRDETWSMDFIFDWLATNQKLKCLTIVAQFTKEAPDLFAAISIKGGGVVEILESLRLRGRKPRTISVDS